MKKILLFAAVVAMSFAVSAPIQAQSRKDKKEAKKEAWEQQQKNQREEEALRHAMRMDSMVQARQAAEEKMEADRQGRLRAEEEQRAAVEEAKAKAKRAEEMAALEEKDVDEPCMDATSSDSYVRARGIGEGLQQQIARTKAQTYAVRDLAAKVTVAVKSLQKLYSSDETKMGLFDEEAHDGMAFEEKSENMIKQVVDQKLSFSTPCEKNRTYIKGNRRVYKCYMIVQANKDELLKPIYDELQKESFTKLNIDYNRFSEEFDREFNKGE